MFKMAPAITPSRVSSDTFSDILVKFASLSRFPESFLEPKLNVTDGFRHLSKEIYDKLQTTSNEDSKPNNILPLVHIDGFDDEQVWQQLELKNGDCVPKFLKTISMLISKKDLSINLNEDTDTNNDHNSNIAIDECENDSDGDIDSDDEIFKKIREIRKKSVGTSQNVVKKQKRTSSVVDDQFFKLSEMEDFLIQEEKRENKKDSKHEFEDSEEEDDIVDYFHEISSPNHSENDTSSDENEQEETSKKTHRSSQRATYEDFFDPPGIEDIQHMEMDDKDSIPDDSHDEDLDTRDISDDDLRDDNGEENSLNYENSDGENVDDILGAGHDRGATGNIKSTFQKQQEKLKEKITELEQINLGDKPWQLKGEISAEGRPENSLMEEYLQFDHTTRQAPVITEETTKKLEDIIIQRIKDKAWDDVERKDKPVEQPFEYRRRVVLDQEKSKQSLADIYEKEYLNQQKKDSEEKEVPEHVEINKMMDNLFSKLDALSNFYYTPKMANTEIRVVSNLPAITVEEVAPVSVSDATLLAPEEIMEKSRRKLLGKTERSTTDKKRERRLKKKSQKFKQKRIELKAKKGNPGLGNKYAKKAAKEEIKKLKGDRSQLDENESNRKVFKSSTAFFSKLQEQVKNQVQEKAGLLKKKKGKTVIGSKLKL